VDAARRGKPASHALTVHELIARSLTMKLHRALPGRFAAGCLIATIALAALLAPARAADKAASADKDGWVNLLPGNDLAKFWTTKGNWSIDDQGVVKLTPREGESGWSRWDAYLWLNKEYKDFEVQFDYMVQKGGNSGFYFHVGDKNSPVATGIEVQIYESYAKGPTGKLTDHDSGGIIPGTPPTKNAARPAGEWNTFHIICKGNNLTVKLNGEVVNEIDLKGPKLQNRPESGAIGFQDHALPLALRNIRIREL
jgi:hypothetical protein